MEREPLDPELRWTVAEEAMFKAAQQRAIEQGAPIYSGLTHGGNRIYVDRNGNRFMMFGVAASQTSGARARSLLYIAGGILAALGMGYYLYKKG